MYIARVKEKDLQSLLSLINDNALDPKKIKDKVYVQNKSDNGFLIGKVTLDDLAKKLENIFFIAKEGEDVIGYIRLDKGFDNEFVDIDNRGGVEWLHLEFKNKYYFKDHFEIGGVLVLPGYGRRNVGSKLLEKALKELEFHNCSSIFSFVPINPIKNEPSLKFHLKNGFKIIAKLKPVDLWGFKNYQSVLLMKDIN